MITFFTSKINSNTKNMHFKGKERNVRNVSEIAREEVEKAAINRYLSEVYAKPWQDYILSGSAKLGITFKAWCKKQGIDTRFLGRFK